MSLKTETAGVYRSLVFPCFLAILLNFSLKQQIINVK